MQKKISLLIVCMMLVTTFSGIFYIKTSAADPTTILYPTDDTFINQHVPGDNMGSVAWLRVRGLTGGWTIYTLMKFDISSIPSGSIINSATLHLLYRTEEGEGDPTGHTLETHRIVNDWNEETVTWNTQPSHDQVVTSSAIVPGTPYIWITWDVTNDVQSFVAGLIANYGWKLIDIANSPDMPYFYSKEYGSLIPYLEIEITPPSIVYVDDNFDTSTPGWGYDHFDVIQDGINAVDVGGTVFVFNGIYYENVFIDKNDITLIGEDKNTTIIDASNGNGNGIYIYNSDFVNISNFTIRNAQPSAGGPIPQGNGVYILAYSMSESGETANDNSLIDCIICNNSNCGVHIDAYDIDAYANNNLILNCEISNNGLSGIYFGVGGWEGGGSYLMKLPGVV